MNNSKSNAVKVRVSKPRRMAQKLAPLVVALGMALPVSSVNATGVPVADLSHTIQNIFTQLWVEGEEAIKWGRSEEHTSELQSLMRISYAVFCLKQKNKHKHKTTRTKEYHEITQSN